jgi:hypothetical protein
MITSYAYETIARHRVELTARQARAAWWRAQRATGDNDPAPTPKSRLDWIAPVATRVAGA